MTLRGDGCDANGEDGEDDTRGTDAAARSAGWELTLRGDGCDANGEDVEDDTRGTDAPARSAGLEYDWAKGNSEANVVDVAAAGRSGDLGRDSSKSIEDDEEPDARGSCGEW